MRQLQLRKNFLWCWQRPAQLTTATTTVLATLHISGLLVLILVCLHRFFQTMLSTETYFVKEQEMKFDECGRFVMRLQQLG